jgi:hypothetical protein
MTPAAFKHAMKRHGVTSGQIAGESGVTGASIGSRLRYGHQPARQMRLVLLSAICERREELYRSARRHRAAIMGGRRKRPTPAGKSDRRFPSTKRTKRGWLTGYYGPARSASARLQREWPCTP